MLATATCPRTSQKNQTLGARSTVDSDCQPSSGRVYSTITHLIDDLALCKLRTVILNRRPI